MNRREFAKLLGVGAIALGAGGRSDGAGRAGHQVAITIDDLAVHKNPKLTGEGITRAMLSALKSHGDVKAAVFACGMRVDKDEGRRILGAWNEGGHVIANHTYSHWNLDSTQISTGAYQEDILHGEAVISGFSGFRKLFRYPFLKEGNTVEKRDGIRAFLRARGYRTGHVTIDASDWYIDERMRARLARNPKADLTGYRDYYLSHVWGRTLFYAGLARRVLGRNVGHTLLIHHNLLNALFLDEVLSKFERRGWGLISAEQAYEDPVFSAAPNILPAGESIIWALAKESGKFDRLLRYPGEDSEYERVRMDRLRL